MPENEGPQEQDSEKKQADEGAKDEGTSETKEASTPEEEEKHLERTAKAAEKAKAKKGAKPRKFSDEERKVLWRKAVVKKARKLKHLSEGVIMGLLVVVLIVHVMPFVKYENQGQTWGPKNGWGLAVDLVKPTTVVVYENEFNSFYDPDTKKIDKNTFGTFPHINYLTDLNTGEVLVKGKRKVGRFEPERPATLAARVFVLVPFGAVILLTLYLLDYKLWMGRLLPGLSFVYGFGSVAYLMLTKMPLQGTWNAFNFMPWWVWLTLMVPLFLVGAFSMLRAVVSHRYKRYEFRGLPVPEHLKPLRPAKPQPDAAPEAAPKTEGAPKAEAAVKADAEKKEDAGESKQDA
jgi:hypothetical protein